MGARVFDNENIPAGASPTYSQFIVGNAGIGLLVFSAPPIVDVFAETEPASLSVHINVRQYVALSVVYANAFCIVSGAAYPATPVFTGA